MKKVKDIARNVFRASMETLAVMNKLVAPATSAPPVSTRARQLLLKRDGLKPNVPKHDPRAGLLQGMKKGP